MKSMHKWAFHFGNSEYWDDEGQYDTREEAIQAGREYAPEYAEEQYGDDEAMAAELLRTGTFEIGELFTFEPYIDAERVIESICEDAYDQAGDFCDAYISAPDRSASEETRKKWKNSVHDLSDRLIAAFNEWAKETGNEPHFFIIEHDETVPIARREEEI
jgi:hypothetical protein